MSLKSLLEKATKIAVNSLGDLNSSEEFLTNGEYTINAFDETVSPSQQSKNVTVMTYSYKESDIDGVTIQRRDLKGLLHVSNLPVGYEVGINDEVKIGTTTYSVVNIRKAPGIMILQLRAS